MYGLWRRTYRDQWCVYTSRQILWVYNSICCSVCWMSSNAEALHLVSCWLLFITTPAAVIDDWINTVWKSNRWLLCFFGWTAIMPLFPRSTHLKFKSYISKREKRRALLFKRQISFTKKLAWKQITPMCVSMFFLFYSLKRVKCSSLLSAYNPVCVEWRVWCVQCSAVSRGNGAESHLPVWPTIRPHAQILSVSHLLMKSSQVFCCCSP